MVDGKEIDSFSTLIRPKGILPVKIKRLTGIKDHELQDAPKLQEVLPVILQFIADLPLVGHNVKFGCDFLSTDVQSPLANPLYDTLELSKIGCLFRSDRLQMLAANRPLTF